MTDFIQNLRNENFSENEMKKKRTRILQLINLVSQKIFKYISIYMTMPKNDSVK